MALLLAFSSNLFAARYYVDKNATGANNGSNWTNAYLTIQNAFASSIVGDEIWVSNDVGKTISVYDITGKAIFNKVINASSFPLELQSVGIYIFKIDGYDAVKFFIE